MKSLAKISRYNSELSQYIRDLSLCVILLICFNGAASGQNSAEARRVLDKTAATVGHKGGAFANFSMSGGSMGNVSGSIWIKGNKFQAATGTTEVWYDGKTQWAYMKSTNEVNITTPNEAQQASMNPYRFITLYKSGYNMGLTNVNGGYQVHLKAIHPARSLQEVYITIGHNYQPRQVRVLQGKKWTTINVTNFQKKNLKDSFFRYNSKKHPSAEIVDLR